MSPVKVPKRRTCAHMVVHELLVETHPEYRQRRLDAEEETRTSIDSGRAMRVTAKLITIPVVVFATVLAYVVIISAKLSRLEREVGELAELARERRG